MSAIPKKFKLSALIVLILLSSYGVVEYVVAKRTTDLRTNITNRIYAQKAIVTEISEITARNGADQTTEAMVRDCSVDDRKAFDVLLGRLDEGLAQSELETLDRLFGRCGYFFSNRKSIMVARLSREVEQYKTYVTQLETLYLTSQEAEYKVETWETLVQEEQKQADLFRNLVRAQDLIITTLLNGESADSAEIKAILGEVSETQGTLTVTSKQTAQLRAQLLAQ
jgi:hypothetical protein